MADMGKVFVYENWKSPNPGKMGTLHMDGGKGREVVSFEYDENWLQDTVERNWRKLAREYGLGRSEPERMAPAFDMAYKR